nr:MAG TPA: hypothetical protein [Caudoviricetes sp.]
MYTSKALTVTVYVPMHIFRTKCEILKMSFLELLLQKSK